jgi:hypothetical protein
MAKRYVVTTAINGCEVHEGFYKSLLYYCKKNDAKLIVLKAMDGNNPDKDFDEQIDPKYFISNTLPLNTNIHVDCMQLNPRSVDPVTGLNRVGQKGSTVFASPKQRLKYIPTGDPGHIHALMTTGAITKPYYPVKNGMNRAARIAENDHIMGAIVVEVKDSKRYFFRQIQAGKSGRFVDWDWHSDSVDPKVKQAYAKISKKLKPKKVIVHDLFDGLSINPHEAEKLILRAQRAGNGQLSLEDEIKIMVKDLEFISKLGIEEVVVVPSNHNEFLDRYLEKGDYIRDPYNKKFATELALAMLNDKDPLRYAVEKLGLKANNINWLRRDQSYKILDIEVGQHGDLGLNGSRGSVKSMEAAYQKTISGHSHTPEALRLSYVVGTSTWLRLTYNRGPSSWFNTCCNVYKYEGETFRQLINIIDGEYILE